MAHWMDSIFEYKSPKDPVKEMKQKTELEAAKEASTVAASIAFGTPLKPETSNEAVIRASKEAVNQQFTQESLNAVKSVKDKLAVNGIDPVALNVVKAENWDALADPTEANKIAKQAVTAHEKALRTAWMDNAFKPAETLNSNFTETAKGNQIASALTSAPVPHNPDMLPTNAGSIFDSERFDKLFEQFKAKDDARNAGKVEKEAKKAEAEKAKQAEAEKLKDIDGLNGNKVVGTSVESVVSGKVANNQISILDDIGGKDSAEQKTKLDSLFQNKIVDNGAKIKEGNQQRKEEIQGKKDVSKPWETVNKPISTNDKVENIFSCLFGKQEQK